MKRYYLLAAVAVIFLFAGCSSHESGSAGQGPGGQGGPGGPGGPGEPVSVEQQVADLKTLLKLSDEQAAAVLPIIKEQSERRKALMDEGRNGGNDEGKTMSQKMDDLEWEIDNKLAKVLTREQMVAYSNWRDAEKEKRSKRPEPPSGGKRGGPPGQRPW